MGWEFTANSREEVAAIRASLPDFATSTVAGELFQITRLLASLARADLVEYPLKARHTGENSVPDFHLQIGKSHVSVETAKVTTSNLEHARSLQMRLPAPSTHFSASDICYPDSLARKLKRGAGARFRFVGSRLSHDCRAWLATWNGRDPVPTPIKELLAADLNSIIDGPEISKEPALANAFPRPDVDGTEKPRDRKDWLEEVFWEELAHPINPTLMVSPFIRQADPRMTRTEVLEAGFISDSMEPNWTTVPEERQIWIEKVLSEVEDKSQRLASGGDFRHGDQDWLLLWDRLSTPDWDLSARADALSQQLALRWKPGWFSLLFVQDEYFRWQLMFTASGIVALPNHT
jgi:hypothetical protein